MYSSWFGHICTYPLSPLIVLGFCPSPPFHFVGHAHLSPALSIAHTITGSGRCWKEDHHKDATRTLYQGDRNCSDFSGGIQGRVWMTYNRRKESCDSERGTWWRRREPTGITSASVGFQWLTWPSNAYNNEIYRFTLYFLYDYLSCHLHWFVLSRII